MLSSLRYAMGVEAFDRRKYLDAIGHFEAVLEESPESLTAREYLVRAHYHRAALPTVEREARTLLQADPTNEYVMLLLARALERQSKHDEATAVRRRLVAISGDAGYAAA